MEQANMEDKELAKEAKWFVVDTVQLLDKFIVS